MKFFNKKYFTFRLAFRICILLSVGLTLYRTNAVIGPTIHRFIDPTYTNELYKSLEDSYNSSQYRVKFNPHIIPDETIIRYAAGAYVRGVDPIYINSEYTPLGKYILGLSILLIKNDSFPILFFGFLTLGILWFLALLVLRDWWLALIPVLFLANEQLFLDQFRTTPLLDIVQLPFVLLALLLFLIEDKRKVYIATALCVGVVMAIKTPIAGVLLVGTFLLYSLTTKNIKNIYHVAGWMFVSAVPLVASYAKIFLDGYSVGQFIGFMKWIILYQQSKLEYPFSAWRLVYLNQWQTWWGDRSFLRAVDWQITWPVFVSLTIVVGVLVCMRRVKTFPALTVLLFWSLVYGAFLSLGVISSRFFLPFLPVLYIIGVYGVMVAVTKVFKKR